MVSTTSLMFAAFAVIVSALPMRRPSATPTLPQLGGGTSVTGQTEYSLIDRSLETELVPPAASLVPKKIAVDYSIQNYSCVYPTSIFSTTGTLAVLHDVTSFYPGIAKTGITQQRWDHFPSNLLWNKPLPLNKLSGSKYGADPMNYLPTSKPPGHHHPDSTSFIVFPAPCNGSSLVTPATGNSMASAWSTEISSCSNLSKEMDMVVVSCVMLRSARPTASARANVTRETGGRHMPRRPHAL